MSSSARLGAGAEPGGGLKAGVYPNPIEAEFTVVIEGAQDQVVSLVVTDLNGRSLLTKQVAVSQGIHQERLGLGNATSGLYLLRVSTAKESQTIKLIKQP